MPGTTPIYGWPYPVAGDGTTEGALGGDMAKAIENTVKNIATTTVNVQVFTASGTWTKPANAKICRVVCVGGGGASGGAAATGASQVSAGSGGQGGAYAESWIDATTLGATAAVTVGAGGTGVAGATGNSGGTSSFGVGPLVSASGGAGGQVNGASGTNFRQFGGVGPQSMVGQIMVPGSPGGIALRLGTVSGQTMGGFGGASALSGTTSPTASGGNTGQAFGGGGGGPENGPSAAAKAGANGADGVVIVISW